MAVPGWDKRIAAAQRQTTVVIDAATYERIAWGSENHDVPTARLPCEECGAAVGQLHVFTCDQETCPKCGGPLNSCGCFAQLSI